MSEKDKANTDSIDELSFDKAEFEAGEEGFACSFCGSELRGFYFQVNGAPSCEQCRYEVEQQLTEGSGSGRLIRAVGAGAIAAALGALLYYAVLALTGYEIGLIAIVVGFMVGWAVRWGARHRGGWGYQTLAAGLTYVAIVSTYVPLLYQAMEEEGAFDEVESTETLAEAPMLEGDADAPYEVTPGGLILIEEGESLDDEELAQAMQDAEAQQAAEFEDVGAAGMALGLVMAIGIILALPFLGGFENIIGLAIIFFALWQAWSMNKRLVLEFEGPFDVGKEPPAVGEPAAEE